MTKSDLFWLAGYLEGEGCFHTSTGGCPCVIVSATDYDVVARAAILMGREKPITERRQIEGHKIVYTARVSSEIAIQLMIKLLPFMGERRAAKIKEVLALAAARPGKPYGKRCGSTKLTEENVREIRNTSPYRGMQSALARKFGVSQAAIWYALQGDSWKSVA